MEEAQSRSEKLRLLKERAQNKRQRDEQGGGSGEGGEGGEGGESSEGGPKLKFRNYKPKTEDLKEAVLPKVEAPTSLEGEGEGKTKVDVQLDIAPKKPNWDLKRDVAKKLEKLERRTQAAIMKLIKQKVAEGSGGAEGSEGAEDSGKALAAAVSSRG